MAKPDVDPEQTRLDLEDAQQRLDDLRKAVQRLDEAEGRVRGLTRELAQAKRHAKELRWNLNTLLARERR